MDSSSPKIIAIIGATGNQGFSVAKTFSVLPHWRVRGITRSASSVRAKELEHLGAEIFVANLDDLASLLNAFHGVQAVFLNTDFWGPYVASLRAGNTDEEARITGYDTEVRHGLNAFHAAAKVPSIERVIYSTLAPMSRASHGKYYRSNHWEGKAAIVDHIFGHHNDEALVRVAGMTSLIYIGAYFNNPILIPKPDPTTEQYISMLPGPLSTRLPIINTPVSTGPFVKRLIETEPLGTRLLAYDEHLTMKDILDMWSKRTGTSHVYQQTTLDEMHKNTGLSYEILDALGFTFENDYCAGVDGVIEPYQLKEVVSFQSYAEYLEQQPIATLLGKE